MGQELQAQKTQILTLQDLIKQPQKPINHKNYISTRPANKCKVQGCDDDHTRHYCRYCKEDDSDHYASKCDKAKNKTISTQTSNYLRCMVSGCKQRHESHYCKVCKNINSDHFSSQCPQGITLYHGTKLQAALSIQKTGFKPCASGRMGGGVYFTPEFDIAAKIGSRAKHKQGSDKFAVLECKFVEESEFVQKGVHPKWQNKIQKISDGQFIQYVVQQQYLNRVKIVKLHYL